MKYLMTQDVWEAVGCASIQNQDYTPKDNVTERRVDVAKHGQYYFVPLVNAPEIEGVGYETMAQHFEVVE